MTDRVTDRVTNIVTDSVNDSVTDRQKKICWEGDRQNRRDQNEGKMADKSNENAFMKSFSSRPNYWVSNFWSNRLLSKFNVSIF